MYCFSVLTIFNLKSWLYRHFAFIYIQTILFYFIYSFSIASYNIFQYIWIIWYVIKNYTFSYLKFFSLLKKIIINKYNIIISKNFFEYYNKFFMRIRPQEYKFLYLLKTRINFTTWNIDELSSCTKISSLNQNQILLRR